jgi:hypothetical protein
MQELVSQLRYLSTRIGCLGTEFSILDHRTSIPTIPTS